MEHPSPTSPAPAMSPPAHRTAPEAPSVWTWVVAAFGFFMTLAVFNPGFMSYDSIEALKQARSGNFGDWYPPLMAWVWQKLEWFYVGPFGMLLVQSLAWWGGLVLIVSAFAPRRAAPFLVLLIGFWPPIFAMVGTIWKDVQMATAFTLAAGWLLLAGRTRTSAPVWGALALLIYGTALRHNAVTAVLPLAIWCGWHLANRFSGRLKVRPALIIALVAVAVVGLPRGLNEAIVRVRDVPVQQVIFGYDLWGMSVYAERNLLPAKVQPKPYSVEELTARYKHDPLTAAAVHYGTTGIQLKFVTSRADVSEFQQAWLDGIRNYPIAYLKHRGQLFVSQFGLAPKVYYPFHIQVDPNPLGVTWAPSQAYEACFRTIIPLKDTLFFRLWVYILALAVCAALVLKAALRRRPSALTALVFSACGLCYFAPYFLISPAADMRYNLWTLMCTLFAILATWRHWRDRTQP